jgi:hypothetical protein
MKLQATRLTDKRIFSTLERLMLQKKNQTEDQKKKCTNKMKQTEHTNMKTSCAIISRYNKKTKNMHINRYGLSWLVQITLREI